MERFNAFMISLAAFAICCFIPSILEHGYANYMQIFCIAIDMFLIGKYSVK